MTSIAPTSRDSADVVAIARRSLVGVRAVASGGTGWVALGNGLVLTSHEAVGYQSEITLEVDATRRVPGRVIWADVSRDLALVLPAEPRNLFIAAFIGSPAMNLVEATIENDEVTFGQYRVPLATPRPAGKVVLGIRPESFEDAAFAPGLPTLNVVVEVVEDLGSDAHVFFHVDAKPVTAEVLEARDESILAGNQALFTARVDARTRSQIGGRLDVAVDASRFHFFDPATGDRLGANARELATA